MPIFVQQTSCTATLLRRRIALTGWQHARVFRAARSLLCSRHTPGVLRRAFEDHGNLIQLRQ